jgi:hypothetical protein
MKIVFAHNVYNRFNTLKKTIDIEKSLFPDSQSIVGYNAESPEKIFSDYKNMVFIKFPGVTHKIGCTNGCISTIKAATFYNPDVIVFSHDDVSINPISPNLQAFNNNCKIIINGDYDAICRKPLPEHIYGKEYYLMEAFFLSKKAAEKAFGSIECYIDESIIPKDARGSISPEVFLYQTLQNKNLNILEKRYEHKLENYNKTLSATMGFTHKNAGERGWVD